jgi:hypothetical protein
MFRSDAFTPLITVDIDFRESEEIVPVPSAAEYGESFY